MLSIDNFLSDTYQSIVARPSATVTRVNGQKRINLRAALDAQPQANSSVQMTFEELARAYLAAHFQGAEMQLRKWIDLFAQTSAWEISSDQIARAGIAMLDNGYSPSTVNRNISQIGSVYRWAKKRLLTPLGFVSPTHGQINPSKLGWVIKNNANRIVGGFEFQQGRAEGRTAWRVVAVKTPPLPGSPP